MNEKFRPSPEMVEAVENVFLAMANEQTIRPIVNEYQQRILAENQWRVNPSLADRITGGIEIILDPKLAYLMTEDDIAIFHSKCNEARQVAGLYVDNDAHCPLLVAEDLTRLAKRALVVSMTSETGLTPDKLLDAGMAKYNEYVDITLRLLAPFAKNPLIKTETDGIPKTFEKGVSESYDKSYEEAEEIAGSKDGWILAYPNEPRLYTGRILGTTVHHVVQNLGKSAAIHEKRNLSKIPDGSEVVSIAYDGKTPAKVSEGRAPDKGVTR